jgi:ribonuclease E
VVEGASALADVPPGDGAPGVNERAPRGRGRDRDRGGDRQERGERAEAGERTARTDERQDARTGEREPRNGRERSVYAARDPGVAAQAGVAMASTQSVPLSGTDERATMPDDRPSRGQDVGAGRRERRSESIGTRDAQGDGSGTAETQQGNWPTSSMARPEDTLLAQTGDAPDAASGEAPIRREGDERRGRSRDRYGRDRRERGPRDETASSTDEQTAKGRARGSAGEEPAQQGFEEIREPSHVAAAVSVSEKEHAFVASQTESGAIQQHLVSMGNNPELSPEPTSTLGREFSGVASGLPRIQSFELPVAALAQIAEGSGLQWVNSNAERIAQVQAAIAAEPPPIHVPRERAPVVVVDEGPLVLVETRRDLANTVLPFERPSRIEEVAQR